LRTHYDVIGVAADATHDEIRRAYHLRARHLHPDANSNASVDVLRSTTEAMAELNLAWSVLGDPRSRRTYDLKRTWKARGVAAAKKRPNGSAKGAGNGSANGTAGTANGSANGSHRGKGSRTTGRPDAAGSRSGARNAAFANAQAAARAGARAGATGAATGSRSYTGRRVPGRTRVAAQGGTGVGQRLRTAADGAVRLRPPRADECRHCGSAPAIGVELRGRLVDPVATLFGRSAFEAGPVCRTCGVALFRDLTDEVLCTAGAALGFVGFVLYGWVFALVRSLGNANNLSRVRSLGAPMRDPLVATRRSIPMDPGPTLWRRRGMARVRAFVVVLVLVALAVVALVLTGRLG